MAVDVIELIGRLDKGGVDWYPLHYWCDICKDAPDFPRSYPQGSDEARNLIIIEYALKPADQTPEIAVRLQLCKSHVHLLYPVRDRIFGVQWCEKNGCRGIIQRTGRTRPIKGGEGVWEEWACDHRPSPRHTSHTSEWEPVD